MKNLFRFLAEYNRQTNLELLTILEQQDPALLHKQTGVYFKSILGTLSHILLADIAWLGRISSNDDKLRTAVGVLPVAVPPEVVDKTWQDLAVYRRARQDVDNSFARLIDAVPEGRVEGTFLYENSKGQAQAKPLWVLLLHLFNHQTHHRGQVATLLDQAGIANDYSGLTPKFGKET